MCGSIKLPKIKDFKMFTVEKTFTKNVNFDDAIRSGKDSVFVDDGPGDYWIVSVDGNGGYGLFNLNHRRMISRDESKTSRDGNITFKKVHDRVEIVLKIG